MRSCSSGWLVSFPVRGLVEVWPLFSLLLACGGSSTVVVRRCSVSPSGARKLLLSSPPRADFSIFLKPLRLHPSALLPSQRDLLALLDQGFEASLRRGSHYLILASPRHVAHVLRLSAQVYCFFRPLVLGLSFSLFGLVSP
ncbi:unnamed protein product [Arabidopsis halleri]